MARALGRHRTTIGREFRRNFSRYDGAYRPSIAQERTNGRRVRSRRNSQFGATEWELVDALLREKFSPEHSGWRRMLDVIEISHQTIYSHVKRDRKLWRHALEASPSPAQVSQAVCDHREARSAFREASHL